PEPRTEGAQRVEVPTSARLEGAAKGLLDRVVELEARAKARETQGASPGVEAKASLQKAQQRGELLPVEFLEHRSISASKALDAFAAPAGRDGRGARLARFGVRRRA